jgi:hypothetical protein
MQIFHGRRFLIEPGCEPQLGEMGINAGMDWVNFASGQLVSDSPTTRCRRISAADGGAFYFKRYHFPFQRGIQFWMRPGKAAVEVWAYRQLAALGIPTLEVVAFGEERALGVLKSNFLVTRAVPDSQDLYRFAMDAWYPMPEPMRRQVYREVSNQLVGQVRRAHKGRLFHHDLKWRNILVQKQGDHYATVWIDAPRASRMQFRGRRGAIVDLAGLARIAVSLLSVYDRMRFVCRCLGKGRKPGDAKRLYRQVAANLGRRPPRPIPLPPRALDQ